MTSTEIVKAEQAIGGLMAEGLGASYCSVKVDGADRAAAAKVFNALNNPEGRVSDLINKEIWLKDVLIEVAELENAETGEFEQAPRVVLIDADGKAYQSISKGMYGAIRNLVKVYGAPTWDPAIKVKIRQKNVGRGSMLTLDALS